jgi:hypothetical protein
MRLRTLYLAKGSFFMIRFRRSLATALVCAAALCGSIPAHAEDTARARFSDTPSYLGKPQLSVTLSTVVAGGGPGKFETTRLVALLAGDKTSAEVAKLTSEYGKDDFASFLSIFDFVISDSLKIASAKGVALPSAPEPPPTDGKALAHALVRLGNVNGSFDVEYMLDGLVSHPIHVQVMDDIDAKFGRHADSTYHRVLQTAMTDLSSAYGF